MGILSNISLEVISLEVICIWLQVLTVKPACFMKKRTQCWQEYKSNWHPWHFHCSCSRQGELCCLALSGRREKLSCWHAECTPGQLIHCSTSSKEMSETQTGSSLSTANVLSIVWGAMLWLSQSSFYAAEHTWQAHSLWKNEILGCYQGLDWKT